MNYSDRDLDAVNADISAAERKREWMSGVVTRLRAANHHTRVAERQQAQFAAMVQAMKKLRAEMENTIRAENGRSFDVDP